MSRAFLQSSACSATRAKRLSPSIGQEQSRQELELHTAAKMIFSKTQI